MSKSSFDQKEQRVDQQQNADNIYNVSQLEKDPFEHEEIMHNASGAARTLYNIGWIVVIVGFLAMIGGIMSAAPIIVIPAFVVFFVGGLLVQLGYSKARSEAYKRRVQSRRK